MKVHSFLLLPISDQTLRLNLEKRKSCLCNAGSANSAKGHIVTIFGLGALQISAAYLSLVLGW